MFPKAVRDDTLKLATLHLAVKRNNEKKSLSLFRIRFCLGCLLLAGVCAAVTLVFQYFMPPATYYEAIYEGGIIVGYFPYSAYSYPEWIPLVFFSIASVIGLPASIVLVTIASFDLTKVYRNRRQIVAFAQKYQRNDIVELLT